MYNKSHNMNRCIHDRTGIQYIFGYFIKNKGWQFVPHRFQLHQEVKNIARGQFLTSLWFSHIYHLDQVQNYMILGIRGGFSYANITQTTNQWDGNNGGHIEANWSEIVRIPNLVFWDTFRIDGLKTTHLINSHLDNELFVLDILGHIFKHKLSLRARRYQGGLYVTLPDFVRSLPV